MKSIGELILSFYLGEFFGVLLIANLWWVILKGKKSKYHKFWVTACLVIWIGIFFAILLFWYYDQKIKSLGFLTGLLFMILTIKRYTRSFIIKPKSMNNRADQAS